MALSKLAQSASKYAECFNKKHRRMFSFIFRKNEQIGTKISMKVTE